MVAKRYFNRFFGYLLADFVVLVLGSRSVHAVEITIEQPGDREFIRDMAGMLDSESKTKIVELCDKVLSDTATPIIVVTIDSMAKHGGAGMRIETFAMLLFNQWEIGHAKLGKKDWNTGILLLVSKGDRKARIELGKGWGNEKDSLCTQIMDEQIITRFKEGKFSEGIVAGVEALDKMAHGLELPPPPPRPPRPSRAGFRRGPPRPRRGLPRL